MSVILDIHTHHPAPQPQGVIAVTPDDFHPEESQFYSVGIHPWQTTAAIEVKDFERLREVAMSEQTVAIGETGIDILRGGPLFRQMQIFKQHIILSEELKKPLIIHDVKAHDIIIGLKKDMNPTQKWAIHGFRAKPSVAKMFTDKGIYLSMGERFNPETLNSIPPEFLMAETDESSLDIKQIIEKLSESAGKHLENLIAENIKQFLGRNI